MEETKKKLFVERDGFLTEAAMLLTALAMVLRLIGSIGRWDNQQYMTTQVALPIFCGLLFLLCLLLFGKRAFWTTVVPVAIGVVFFIFRAMNLENEWIRGCWIIVYLVIMVLYAMVFSYPGLKWVLALALLAVFAYHIGVQDLPKLMDLENPVTFVEGMEEMSVLGIILAMLCVTLAMKAAPKAKAEAAPEPEPEQITAAEEDVSPSKEEKLSRREKRRLEKQKKLEEKKRTEEKPEIQQEAQQTDTQHAPAPVESTETASAPLDPVTEENPPQEKPQQEREPETNPVPEEPLPVNRETEAFGETSVEEIPVEELSIREEAEPAYPLEESPQATVEIEPDDESGPQTP